MKLLISRGQLCQSGNPGFLKKGPKRKPLEREYPDLCKKLKPLETEEPGFCRNNNWDLR